MGGRKKLDDEIRESLTWAHSIRFRTFGNRWPLTVSYAFQGDLAKAMRSTDKQVARRVVAWAKREGLPPSNWNYATALRAASGKGR